MAVINFTPATLPPTAVIVVSAVVYVIWLIANELQRYISRRQMAKANNCQPLLKKIPYKVPYLALDLLLSTRAASMNNTMLETSHNRFMEYGRTHKLRMLGRRVIATIEPENVKTILSLRFNDFALVNRINAMGKLMGRGIFTTDGDEWHESRAMIRPNFIREQVADLDAFERHFQNFLKMIPTDGTTVDLQNLFFGLTIDSATEFLFGESVHSLKPATSDGTGISNKSFSWAFGYSQEAIIRRFRWGPFSPIFHDKLEDEAVKICHDFVDKYVDRALHYRETHAPPSNEGKEKGKYLFIHELAKATTDKTRLRSELINVLLAGRDTTASLLSNMFFVVAKRPDVWIKIRREVENELHGKIPTYQQLRNLKYVKYCMNESLRLHAVVPMNFRVAIRDTVIPMGGGADGKSPILVAAGTSVSYSSYSMHRDERWYGADAHEFRPERWETLRPGWEYLPFNGGPRICPGQQYALTEAAFVTVRIAQSFKGLESRDPNPWTEWLTLTLASKDGCRVSLTPV